MLSSGKNQPVVQRQDTARLSSAESDGDNYFFNNHYHHRGKHQRDRAKRTEAIRGTAWLSVAGLIGLDIPRP
jgi:hypothetical protein